jgi:hypothetical protein
LVSCVSGFLLGLVIARLTSIAGAQTVDAGAQKGSLASLKPKSYFDEI